MKQIGIAPAPLLFDESGRPMCAPYDAPYLPLKGPLHAATRFADGASRCERFGLDGETFSVLEVGFGLGANFLATVARWQRAGEKESARQLDYTALEIAPLSRLDFTRAWQACGLAYIGDQLGIALTEHWPDMLSGTHRIQFSNRITLTLVYSDAVQSLPTLQFAADAIYLDAYDLTTNPSLWVAPVMRSLAARARSGSQLVSCCAQARACDALNEMGFVPEQVAAAESASDWQGCYARFVPRFERRLGLAEPRRWSEQSAIVIGAGIAGMTCAQQLAATGWQVSVIDRQSALYAAPQQQPALAAHLHFSADDNPMARLTRAAYLLMRSGQPPALRSVGRIALESDGRLEAMAAMLQDCPPDFVRRVSAADASDIAGTSLPSGALWLPELPVRYTVDQALPEDLLRSLGIRWIGASEVIDLQRLDGQWRCADCNQEIIASASVVVLATGQLPSSLSAGIWPGVIQHYGQSTTVRADSMDLRCVIGGTGYACPLPDTDLILAGAATVDPDAALAPDHLDDKNIAQLAEMTASPSSRLKSVASHTGIRYTTRDHLPFIGPMPDVAAITANAGQLSSNDRLPLPDLDGVYLATGFGSRGLLWSHLAAQCITDHVNNISAPLPTDLSRAIAPNRFLRRMLRKGQLKPPPVVPLGT